MSEEGFGADQKRQYAFRVDDLITKAVTKVDLPYGCTVTDWSADGKRFLIDLRPNADTVRVAWLKADGTGKPEYVSPEKEVGYGGRVSPDGQRVLYQSGPETAPGKRVKVRLYVQDLATGKRTAVDEEGETFGHCWAPDGTRVAYTWQRALDKPEDIPERETLLVAVDPDGRNRKVLTSRKCTIPENASGRGLVWFFTVIDWR
jgi:hypothetical protein